MSNFEYVDSWETDDQLDYLTKARRDRQILEGFVHILHDLDTSFVQGGSEEENPNMEIVQIMLPNGGNVYCAAEDFSEYPYRTLRDFVGTTQKFLITDINLETRVVKVSVKDADAIAKEAFTKELTELKKNGQLSERTYKGVVRGIDPRRNTVYVRVNGVDCRMSPNEWDWSHYYNWEISDMVQRGETINVKVLDYNEENGFIRVSRKATITDPYESIKSLKIGTTVAGEVVKVHPVHGIFVSLPQGLDAKGGKLPHLPEPEVGDIVSCTIEKINPKDRRCKVMIRRYPNGKRERPNATAFMFNR